MTAVDSGRQRQLLQHTQNLISELKSLPLDADTNRQAFGKVFELVYAFKRFQDTTASMPPSDAKTMWEQRSSWLQEEIAALAAERIQSKDHRQFWQNLFGVLEAAVQACDVSAQQREALDHQLGMLTRQLQEARSQNEQLQQHAAAAPAAAASAAWTEEALELKSKLVVAQQEVQKKTAELKNMGMKLQYIEAERDNLQKTVDDLSSQKNEHVETTDRQIEVIQQMMVRNEECSTQLEATLKENTELSKHCQTLSVNLETNARVIEKIIELNTELMDSLNDRAFSHDRAATSSVRHTSGMAYTPAPILTHPSHTTHHAGSQQLPVSTSANGYDPRLPSPKGGDVRVTLPVTNGQMGTGQEGTPKKHLIPPGNPPPGLLPTVAPLPSLPPLKIPEANGTAATTTAPDNNNAASLTAAFQAFLTDPDSPRQATAASLALPIGGDIAKTGGPRSGKMGGGVLSTAQNLMRFVAGGDLASPSHGSPKKPDTAAPPLPV